MNEYIYNRYSDYLKNKYGCRVYKLPISIPVSCPNRINGLKGCTYCDESGAGFDNISGVFSIAEQIYKNMEYIGKKYKAKKFSAYFQNFTNTFLPLNEFEKYIQSACVDNIVELSVSTRPDCIKYEYLDALKYVSNKFNVDITIELGLQSANIHTLNKINRGHGIAEFIDAVMSIKKYGFKICTHVILNIPWDDIYDCIEAAKIITVLGVDFVKLHSLYIAKNTVMAKQYENKEFNICDIDEYTRRVSEFIRHVSKEQYFERIVSRPPKENTIFANWGRSNWYLRDYIESYMLKNGFYQSQLCNYMQGKALRLL